MPLHVDIRVNDELIHQLHIGRMEHLYSAGQVSKYLVVGGEYEPWAVPYSEEGIPFTHKYSDGALVCVQRAIAALNDSQV